MVQSVNFVFRQNRQNNNRTKKQSSSIVAVVVSVVVVATIWQTLKNSSLLSVSLSLFLYYLKHQIEISKLLVKWQLGLSGLSGLSGLFPIII